MPIKLVIILVLAPNSASAETPQTAGRLHNILDEIVRRHPPGDTKLAREDSAQALVEEVKKTCPKYHLEFRAKILRIRWQSDILSITTEQTLGLPYDRKARLKISRHTPIKVQASREVAAKIKPGQFVEFVGKTVFVPSGIQHLKEHTAAGQLIFSVNVDTWSAGSYRSKEFTLTVNRTKLPAP